jgi:hypothetical protein
LKPEKANQFVVRRYTGAKKTENSPTIGRVSLVRRSLPRLLKRRRRKRSSEDFEPKGRRNFKVIACSVTLAVATGAVLLGFVVVWLKKTQPGTIVKKPVMEARVVSRFPSPSSDEALELVRKAIQIQNPAAMEASFHLEGTAPNEALETLQKLNKSNGPAYFFRWLGSLDLNGMLMNSVLIHYQSKESEITRLAALTPNETGVWKVDFHSFARTNNPAWDEIIKEDSKGGRVRVLLSKDNYYNRYFSDDGAWACYSLKTQESDVMMFGYCRVGSAQNIALKRILGRATDKGIVAYRPHAVLELRRVENAETRQIEITRVLAEGWVMSDVALDKTSQDLPQ